MFALRPIDVVSQTYDEYTLQATELYHAEKYQESSLFWDKAFRIQGGFSSDYYNSACTNALAGNNDVAFRHLEKAIINGWEDIDWMKKDSDLASLKDHPCGQSLLRISLSLDKNISVH